MDWGCKTIKAGTTAVVLCACAYSAAFAETQQVKLTQMVLKHPDSILSETNFLSKDNYGDIQVSKKGTVMSLNTHNFIKTPTLTLTLAGEPHEIVYLQPNFVFKTGKTGKPIKKTGDNMAPLALTLANKMKYVVVFPGSYVGPTFVGLSYRSGMAHSGKVDGQAVSLYDANTDGLFTRAEDCLQNGEALVFAPIAGHFSTSSAVYKMEEIADTGESFSCSKSEDKVAFIQVKFSSKGSECHLAMAGDKTDLNFTTTGKGEKCAVLPGAYKPLYGLVCSSKLGKAFCGMVPGDCAPVEAAEGATAELKLGAPFKLNFTPEHKEPGKFGIAVGTISVTGCAGEKYLSVEYSSRPAVYVNGKSNGSMEFG